jgi:hypothetical protein
MYQEKLAMRECNHLKITDNFRRLHLYFLVFFLTSLSPLIFAHSGRLDSYGCHQDNIHGGYHCHREKELAPLKIVEYWGHIKALVYYSDIKKKYPDQKTELLEFGEKVLVSAQQEFDKKDYESWQEDLEWLLQIADTIISLSPGTSWAKDTYEFISGKELLSQKNLDEKARYLAAIGMLSGGIGNGGFTALKMMEKSWKVVSKFSPNQIGLPVTWRFLESAKTFGITSKESLFSAKQITPSEVDTIYATIESTSKSIIDWIGSGGRFIKNESKDVVILSKDKTRRVRFDLHNPHPVVPPFVTGHFSRP